MPLTISLLRPDDLLVLEIDVYNLRLDASKPKNPMLVVEDRSQRAYLVVNFQPQHIAEQAYFEVDPNIGAPLKFSTPTPNPNEPTTTTMPTTDPKLDTPGSVGSRIADSSRLVFRLPVDRTQIPFQSEALLNWAGFELMVSAVAAVPDDNTYYPGLAVAPPAPLETALELPYRLILSPNANVGWEHARTPVIHAGRAELWHTRIARLVPLPNNPAKTVLREPDERAPVPLRAIWSPDFIDHGPLPSHAQDTLPFLMSMSPRDRAQLVILTSGFDGYYVDDPTTGLQQNFIPKPVHATRLFLSSLGGWLSSRGDWWPLPYYYEPIRPVPATFFPHPTVVATLPPIVRPPGIPIVEQPAPAAKAVRARMLPAARGPVVQRPPPIIRRGPVQALDLSEWVHLAAEGRDDYVRIVYEGYLYPFGHRAALIKVTERKVIGSDVAPGGSPVAYLRQRMYIVVREQDKTYSPGDYQYAGREMPFLARVRINTRVTPDIDFPQYLPKSTASFWVLVNKGGFPFHLMAQDIGGSQCDFLAALIFVADSETNLGAVPAAYTADNENRKCVMRGQNVTYADPAAGDTSVKTTALFFNTQYPPHNQTPPPQPPFDTAPFIPWLEFADVKIPALEELLGISPATTIQYYAPYLNQGLDSNAGVYADLVGDPVGVQFSANKSGGFATPNLGLTALSARKGLISGSPDDAAGGVINPAQFFSDVQAKLFGTIPLGNLIPVNALGVAPADQNAPVIRTRFLPNHKHPTQAVTHIKWQPQLQDYSVGPVTIAFNADGDNSALVLNVQIVRKLDGSAPSSAVSGKLSSFRVELLGVIGLKFTAITYSSTNGSKTVVVAHLANKNPIVFEGPLQFIQTLANILPPGLFGGKGPAIDLAPTMLKVSYTLGLPPVSIGVFSLENISIMAGLDLPYLDGKPAVEFAFATRGSPFLLTVECLGGGGFVHVVLDADGIQMVEGALEFGGEFSIDLGVASGGVHIMAGIYFQLKGSSSDLTGFVDIGGEVSVLGIISVSIDLNLSLSWQHTPQGDKVQGRATLTISVSVMFFSISVQVSVERSFGSGSGDPRVNQVIAAEDWTAYALAFA